VNLLIVGASARSAAWSARRAGLMPSAADLFADRDLASVAPCTRVCPRDYPDGLLDAADTFSPGPWIYTGAIENRPDLIEALSRQRPLRGNHAATVRDVRDPVAVSAILRAAGLPATETRSAPPNLPLEGAWLRKPLASAGGLGIEHYTGSEATPERPSYYQRRCLGPSLSAVFVGTEAGAVLASITRQLIGRPGAAFVYRGNVAPWRVTDATARQLIAIGRVVAERFGLVGLFGIDFVVERDGEPRAVEVNPRYTASVEVIELAIGRPLLSDHLRACEGLRLQEFETPAPAPRRHVAKEIVFAEAGFLFEGDAPVDFPATDPFRVPRAADIPHRGTRFAPGEPVLTVFGEGKTVGAALRALARERTWWEQRFRRCGITGS
jgi:uncharacterized protein